MPLFKVRLIQTASTAVTVEAATPEAAVDLAYSSEDMPGSLADPSVTEAGDWEVIAVSNEAGEDVWPADSTGATGG